VRYKLNVWLFQPQTDAAPCPLPHHRGHINFTSIYIAWLTGAVFYHLPSLDSMGVNIKVRDLSTSSLFDCTGCLSLRAPWKTWLLSRLLEACCWTQCARNLVCLALHAGGCEPHDCCLPGKPSGEHMLLPALCQLGRCRTCSQTHVQINELVMCIKQRLPVLLTSNLPRAPPQSGVWRHHQNHYCTAAACDLAVRHTLFFLL